MQSFDRSNAIKKASELLASLDGAPFAVRLLHFQCRVLEPCPPIEYAVRGPFRSAADAADREVPLVQ
jgi:hypothetical protein